LARANRLGGYEFNNRQSRVSDTLNWLAPCEPNVGILRATPGDATVDSARSVRRHGDKGLRGSRGQEGTMDRVREIMTAGAVPDEACLKDGQR
jgi:hypothetical protein